MEDLKRSFGAPAFKVLAADDNALNQKMMAALLHSLGVTYTMVDNGAQLLRKWREERWDLVLTDVEMPEMDGVTATMKIRSEELQTDRMRTPILAVTAHGAAFASQYMSCGFDLVIAKPVEVKPFLRLVAGYMERSGIEGSGLELGIRYRFGSASLAN